MFSCSQRSRALCPGHSRPGPAQRGSGAPFRPGQFRGEAPPVSRGLRVRSPLRRSLLRAPSGGAAPPSGRLLLRGLRQARPGTRGRPGRALRSHDRAAAGAGASLPAHVPGGAAAPLAALAGTGWGWRRGGGTAALFIYLSCFRNSNKACGLRRTLRCWRIF